MGGTESGQEIEIKLRVSSAEAGRAMLEAAGFLVRHERSLERNTLYDDGERSLRARGDLVRVRSYGDKVILTYKRKGGEQAGTVSGSLHKYRPEQETEVGEAEPLIAVLTAAGLMPVLRYEKYRTIYSRDGAAGLATLDETPIGVFLELEGEPAWIDEMAALLGFGAQEYVTLSYLSLHEQQCIQKGLPVSDMVFG